MKKNLLLVAAFFVGIASYAQECTPVAELDENFNAFTFSTPGTGLPQNCWSNINTGPLVYISGASGNNYATFYASSSPNVDAYLVSPELTTLGGNYQLSFDTQRVLMGPPPSAGTVTIQLGTLSSNTDAATFVAFGSPIAVTDAIATHANIAITAAEGQKYIAFKIVGNTAHNAALIDNVVWSEIPCAAVATLNENFNSFTPSMTEAIHENCWSANSGAPLIYVDGQDGENYPTFYAAGSANTAGYLVSPELTSIDGTHQLSFDAFTIGNPTVVTTVQIGTLTSATDFTSFVAVGDAITLTSESITYDGIVIPASDAHKFIAFKLITNNAHGAAGIDNVNWDVIPAEECAAVATLDEGFSDFAITSASSEAFPQNCWNAYGAATGGPWLYTAQTTDASNQYAVYYTHMAGANVPGYFVTPELSTIDGDHKLSFDAYKLGFGGSIPPGNITVQVGTLSDLADLTTFEAVGTAVALTDASVTYDNIVIPASATQKYIAFKFISDSATSAAALDNVKWSEVVAGIEDLNKTSFSIYPNPTADRNITISHNLDTKGSVNIYSLTGSKVYTGELDTTGTQNLNLSSLSAGMYIVKIESGNYSESKKLVIQ